MPASTDVLEYFERRTPEMLASIERLVNVESPSSDVSALNLCAAEVDRYLHEMTGITPTRYVSGDEKRPHLQLDLGDRSDVLLIGHFDTVHPVGAVADHPFRIDGDRAYGPGALDMKGGVVIMAEVARYLLEMEDRPNVTLFLNSDEEIGSTTSGVILRRIAAGGRIALDFESTYREGLLKVGARGVRQFDVTARGKGGHAAYPENYVNPADAIPEIITAARRYNDPKNGVVVTPTVLQGSGATNAVPDEASVHFDVRGTSEAKLEDVEKGLRRISCADNRISISVEIVLCTPTFEMRDDNYAMALAVRASAELGLVKPQGIEARGASDTNQVAPVIPHALEGLGGWGEGLHHVTEYLHVSSLAPSAALSSVITRTALAEVRATDESVQAASEAI